MLMDLTDEEVALVTAWRSTDKRGRDTLRTVAEVNRGLYDFPGEASGWVDPGDHGGPGGGGTGAFWPPSGASPVCVLVDYAAEDGPLAD